MDEVSDKDSLALTLAIVERSAIVRCALRRECASLLALEVVCEACDIGGVRRPLDQARAILFVLLGPSINIAECLELQDNLTRSPQPQRLLTLQTLPRVESVRALVQAGIAGILDEEASKSRPLSTIPRRGGPGPTGHTTPSMPPAMLQCSPGLFL